MDFYLPEARQLIQVTQSLDQPGVREREIRALADAMRGLQLTHSLLLAEANAPPVEAGGLTIQVRSTAEWLLAPQITP